MKVRFTYTKEARQFNYRPRYYDPEKEARELRRMELRGSRPSEGEYVPGTILKSKVEARQTQKRESRRPSKEKNVRLVIMLLAIGAAIVLLFLI